MEDYYQYDEEDKYLQTLTSIEELDVNPYILLESIDQMEQLPVQDLFDLNKHYSLYNALQQVESVFLKYRILRLLTKILNSHCDLWFAQQLQGDILYDLKNTQNHLLLQVNQFKHPQLKVEFLMECNIPLQANLEWKKSKNIIFGSTNPVIFVFPNDILVYGSSIHKKNENSFIFEVVYNNRILKNQSLRIDDKKYYLEDKLIGEVQDIYQLVESNQDIQITQAVPLIVENGFMNQLLLHLQDQLLPNRINIQNLLYDCFLFDQQWQTKVCSSLFIQNLRDLCLLENTNLEQQFHQTIQLIYQNFDGELNDRIIDLLLIRLGQYCEAHTLDLKQGQGYYKEKKEIIVEADNDKSKNQKKQAKSGKPKGVGYGDIQDTGQVIAKASDKKQLNYYECQELFTHPEASNVKWQVVSSILKNLQKLQPMHLPVIENSVLIPVLKSLFSSLGLNDSLTQKSMLINPLFDIFQVLLLEEYQFLIVSKEYGNSLFEVLQKSQTEAQFQADLPKDIQAVREKILDLFQQVTKVLEENHYLEFTYEETGSAGEHLEGLYPIIMKKLLIGTAEITKQQGWLAQLQTYFQELAKTPPQQKMSTLIKEYSEIAESLPVQITNSIFIRYDQNRMDAMQTIIFGSSGTPYAHGAFLYNFLFCDDYPQRPPKCLLQTTGHGKVRFNPNLYNCGKVCLSLLGTWGDNWIAGKSTLLQILISIQAMVMSEYVYFNEPGWESSMGTPHGDMANRSYCNIVKLANIKYAMIEQIKKPPVGFEEVVLKSFYLRKDAIYKELELWLKEADLPATYENSQNPSISQPFQQDPTLYRQVLTKEIENLKKELDKLKISISQNPQDSKKVIKITNRKSIYQLQQQKIKNKKLNDQKLNELLNTPLERVDVQETALEHKIFDSNSPDLQNLMSRYIGVMGLDSVTKQSQASVLLYGLSILGIEVAKNIVLSGIKRLTVIDGKYGGSTFFAKDPSNRLTDSLKHLQALNPYVEIDSTDDLIVTLQKYGNTYQVVCLTEIESQGFIQQVSQLCRQHNIGCIASDVNSVFGRVFVDFGDEFIIYDKDGESIQDFMIESIAEDGTVTCKNQLQTGDIVELFEIQEKNINKKSLKKQQFIIKSIGKNQFNIGDLSEFNQYVGNGRGIQIKQKIKASFQPLHQIYSEPIFDQQFLYDQERAKKVNEQINILIENRSKVIIEIDEKIEKSISATFKSQFAPQAAFLGGLVCQEIIKAITHKYTPIQQVYIHSCEELLDATNSEDQLENLLGKQTKELLENAKLFVIGAGAIGCELLKNYAMINLGTQGKIIVTDPDAIEKSNLSRQFLFREKHIRKLKSTTAANAVLAMNPNLKITARSDRVGPDDVYTNVFYEYVDIVTNALDNVQARLYVDQRCIANQRPLIESGTLGPKGHTQVIIPFKTESYGTRQDPQQDNDIPYCTLKMFPEDTNHCLEWARDKFEKIFFLKNQQVIQCLEFQDPSIELLEQTVKYIKRRPTNFQQCLQFAMDKFMKFFNHGILQLLKAYPQDHMANGKPFWSPPKRLPQLAIFKGEDYQLKFIKSTALLYAQVHKVEIPQKDDEYIIQQLQDVKVKQFQIDESKLQALKKEVGDQKQAEQVSQDVSRKELILQILNEYKGVYTFEQVEDDVLNIKKVEKLAHVPTPIAFEKDEDDNHHIDFIQAATNCRAFNYGLPQLDWLQAKLKAGRIVPAMASTTACIAGLQTIEVIKVLKKLEVTKLYNTFLNLAIPLQLQSEPGECQITKINDEQISFWTRHYINLKDAQTIKQLIDKLEDQYQGKVSSIKWNAKLIYLPLLIIGKQEEEIRKFYSQPLSNLLDFQDDYVELDVEIENKTIPKIRLHL